MIVTGRDGRARLEDVPIGRVAVFLGRRRLAEAWIAADRETRVTVSVEGE